MHLYYINTHYIYLFIHLLLFQIFLDLFDSLIQDVIFPCLVIIYVTLHDSSILCRERNIDWLLFIRTAVGD